MNFILNTLLAQRYITVNRQKFVTKISFKEIIIKFKNLTARQL